MKNVTLEGHLLLVEDTRDVRFVISRLIEYTGVSVDGCESGEDALRLSEHTAFDLALIDLGLPGISGFETLRALRAAGHNFPCFALSGDSSQHNHALWLECGGQGFISKPVAKRKLYAHLERWLAPMGAAATTSGSLQERFITAMIEHHASLREAVAARDYKRVVEIAHRMKGTCGTFRASEAANAAARVLRSVEGEVKDEENLDRAYEELAQAIAQLSVS